MASSSRVLTDHDEIREWAEERGAKPACVQRTGQGEIGMIRLEFPGAPNANDANLDEIGWEDFFGKFDESQLALLVQDELASGGKSNFNKLIGRETAAAAERGEKTSRRAKKGQGIAKGRGGSGGGSRYGGAGAKKSASKSSGGSRGAAAKKSSGAKSTAKKSSAKKSSPAKSSAKSSAKKSSGGARGAAAKKSSGAKASAKKSSAKKSSGAKSAAKKSGAKSSAKKSGGGTSAKKSPAKKTAAKKKVTNAGGRMQVKLIMAPRGAEIDIKTKRGR